MPVQQIASIVADGELLNITTMRNERHTITYRLKDLERMLDPASFIRLGRGTLANVDQITQSRGHAGRHARRRSSRTDRSFRSAAFSRASCASGSSSCNTRRLSAFMFHSLKCAIAWRDGV